MGQRLRLRITTPVNDLGVLQQVESTRPTASPSGIMTLTLGGPGRGAGASGSSEPYGSAASTEIGCPMKSSVECSCGQILAVRVAQAGTTMLCGCGAQVKVPSLSKLRERGGQNAYEASTIDVIHGMLRRGELPTGDRCAVSGDPTGDVES